MTKGAILDRMAREVHFVQLTSERRLELSEGISQEATEGKGVPGI